MHSIKAWFHFKLAVVQGHSCLSDSWFAVFELRVVKLQLWIALLVPFGFPFKLIIIKMKGARKALNKSYWHPLCILVIFAGCKHNNEKNDTNNAVATIMIIIPSNRCGCLVGTPGVPSSFNKSRRRCYAQDKKTIYFTAWDNSFVPLNGDLKKT